METIMIEIKGFMPGSEVQLSPMLAKTFTKIKEELKTAAGESYKIKLIFSPSIIDDDAILFKADQKINLNEYFLGREEVQAIISRNIYQLTGKKEIIFSPVSGVYLTSSWQPEPLEKGMD